MFENISSDIFYASYVDAVEQVSKVKTIYIDLDIFDDTLNSAGIDYNNLDQDELANAIYSLPDFEYVQLKKEMSAILEDSLEKQQPGIVGAISERYKYLSGYNLDFGRYAINTLILGPNTDDNIILDGEVYGIVALPAAFIDSRDEVIEFLAYNDKIYSDETLDLILKNTPGSDSDWARIIGFHEAAHLNRTDGDRRGDVSDVEVLAEEARADRVAIRGMLSSKKVEWSSKLFSNKYDYKSSNIGSDVALAYKDLRILKASPNSAVHSTTPLLDSGDPASILHTILAKVYVKKMVDDVNEKFNFEAFKGRARNAYELLKENPDEFFKVINKSLEETRDRVVNKYNKDPSSFDSKLYVVATQILTDYINDYEDAYRRRVLGQDIPWRKTSAQFIPQFVEDSLYEELKNKYNYKDKQDEQVSTEYQQGVDGTAYTAVVSLEKYGEPKVYSKEGFSLDNISSILNIFSQNADPQPENVILVNAKALSEENACDSSVTFADRSDQLNQSYQYL